MNRLFWFWILLVAAIFVQRGLCYNTKKKYIFLHFYVWIFWQKMENVECFICG